MKTPTGAKLWVMEMYVSVFFVPGFIACLSTNAHLVSLQHTVEPFVREKTTVTLLALVRLLLHDLPLCGTLETAGFFTSSTSPSPRTRPDPERRGERRRVGDPTAIVDRRPRIVMVAHYLPRQPRRQGGRVGCKRGRGSSLISTSTSVCIVLVDKDTAYFWRRGPTRVYQCYRSAATVTIPPPRPAQTLEHGGTRCTERRSAAE